MQKISLFAVSVAFTVLACGPVVPNVPTVGISNSKEAARATKKVNNAVSEMQARASRQLAFSSEWDGTCATSGSARIKATVSVTGTQSDATGVKNTITLTADQCYNANDFRVSGTVVWGFSAVNQSGNVLSGFTLQLDGKVAFESFNDDGTIDQSGVLEYNALSITLTMGGTAEAPTFDTKVSGSYKVGGITYTPTSDEWGSSWFGF